jgi:hypothetical protein
MGKVNSRVGITSMKESFRGVRRKVKENRFVFGANKDKKGLGGMSTTEVSSKTSSKDLDSSNQSNQSMYTKVSFQKACQYVKVS